MLHILVSVIGILVTIFFVIGTHEAAHFGMAKLLGVKVLRFSIGFGKALFSWHDRAGTEYVFAWIPLGGYVKMLDETEGIVPPKELHLAYNRQPFYKKFLIVLAGPVSNLLCAFLLYWIVFMIGYVTVKPIIGSVLPNSVAAESGLKAKQEIMTIDGKPTPAWNNVIFRLVAHSGNQEMLPIVTKTKQKSELHLLDLSSWRLDGLNPDPLLSLGIRPFEPVIPLVIGIIKPGSPAAESLLKVGDRIFSIKKKPVSDWVEFITTINNHPDETLQLTIIRDGRKIQIPIHIGSQQSMWGKKTGYFGIAPTFEWPKEYLNQVKYPPIKAVPHAFQETLDLSYFNLLLFGKMITGKISLDSLGGPITIFDTAGNALNYGFLAFISFLAFLSISIGIINLLPIPGLDGGHLVIQTIELIIRRPLPEAVVTNLYRFGFLLLFFVLFQALANDILRLY